MPDGDDRKVVSMRLDPELHAKATLVAKVTGRSLTEFTAEALEAHIAARLTDPAVQDGLRGELEQLKKLATTLKPVIDGLLAAAES